MLQYIILKSKMVTQDTQCYFAHSALHTSIPTPTREAVWLPGGSVPCAHVTLSLLPAQVLTQAEEQGSDPIPYILHKHLGKPMEGHSTPSLQWHCQLETLKLNTKIGLTFGYNFISAVFPICPSTFLMEDSQIDNKIPGFSAR